MSDEITQSRARVRVWDVPTRLFHWLLVAGFGFSWWTGDTGRLEWHRWSGYLLLGLVIFRIYWGFFGSSTARFSGFLRGPRAVVNYVRGSWEAHPGHNPIGAISVFVMLVLLALQIGLGLFAVDVDGIESGPLSTYVSFETGRAAAQWHESIFDALLWLVALHVVAIAYYLVVKRENLTAAMFHGTHSYPGEVPPVKTASVLRLVLGVVIAVLLTWAVTRAFQLF